MVELTIRLKETNERRKLERKVNLLTNTIRIIVILGFVSMVILACYFMVVLRQLYAYCYFDAQGTQICSSSYTTITFKQFMEIMGSISGIFYSVLTISLVASFVLLNRALKNRFQSEEMIQLSKAINFLFLVLVISFALRTLFLFGEGHYEGLVK